MFDPYGEPDIHILFGMLTAEIDTTPDLRIQLRFEAPRDLCSNIFKT